MTERDLDNLFTRTLSGDYEDEAPWEAVMALRLLGTREVLEKAADWCKANNPLVRARGADVLAQLGTTIEHPVNSFPEESYAVVVALLQRETEPLPLASAIAALGHLRNPIAVPLIANASTHPNPEVRFDVAFALGCFPNESLSTATLLQLMQDEDDDVRDWATFGLGVQSDCDSTEIRDGLIRCVSDSNDDVREEAIVGLARRKDTHVLSALLAGLEQASMTDRVIEAAYLMLDMEHDGDGWKGKDYAAALRKRFVL